MKKDKVSESEENLVKGDQDNYEELFLKLYDLENQRKQQGNRSINIKTITRKNRYLINTYKNSLEQKIKIIDGQQRKIGILLCALEAYKESIENVEKGDLLFNEYLEQQQRIQRKYMQNHNQQPTFNPPPKRSHFKNINEIPSDFSMTKDENNKPKQKKGTWTEKERQLYYQFLDENRFIFENEGLRYTEKIFAKLSNLIKTRTSAQCRKFHKQCYKSLYK